ncbi:NifB/NifX family molybdenum-iron cluster-binding protein [Acetanaerobacterium elongatum]|uniref:Predicted Fe-Mo cluster-binding protein, NifX family n=1 Tax=Acetanaerobacterium elongatum TaxID=258515 RepID=A0A1G9WLB2_9FIRM|nr:NifB/NifX family molybdenum-iron cluster-binding protein [Acetanaerobacterium elongatum]SDM85290.1 Predicted Fe-Mo cluster-binding protein, NifX family [Acetanaerobacterium elongatum]
MKIAVTTQDNQVFQHFGQCSSFTVFTAEDGAINNKVILDASQHGHAALAGFLKAAAVDVVICGGIGQGARQMLSSAGIELISGIDGSIEDAVKNYLSGQLNDMGGSCNHEEHEHNHVCNCEKHCS